MRRLFWIGAATLLGIAALISIVALLRGEFTETDGDILATLGAAALAGATALGGMALVDRRDLLPLGWAATLGGVVGFGVLAWEIWRRFDGEAALFNTLTLLAAGLLLTTSRLLLRNRRLTWLYWTSAAATGGATVLSLYVIQVDPVSDGWAKALGSCWILAALGWFLVPVLGRTTAPERERVVGCGPGRVEVELAAGETLVVRGG